MPKIYPIMFYVSMGMVVASIVVLAMYGLVFGVDFKGGSLIELSFTDDVPAPAELRQKILEIPDIKDVSISTIGDKGAILRMEEIDQELHQKIVETIRRAYPDGNVQEERFDSIGPAIGQELRNKSVTAVLVVLAGIAIYIAFVFRKLSRTLSPWAMSVAVLIALFHDVVIPIGVFAWLGHFRGIEINAIFVAAILTILGYSVSDSVVVFDRIRENILRGRDKDGFDAVIHKSIIQTLTRSVNTSLTTLFSLIAIFMFGGESIKYFSLALIIGIFLGAYSSIFVGAYILSLWNRRKMTGRTRR